VKQWTVVAVQGSGDRIVETVDGENAADAVREFSEMVEGDDVEIVALFEGEHEDVLPEE